MPNARKDTLARIRPPGSRPARRCRGCTFLHWLIDGGTGLTPQSRHNVMQIQRQPFGPLLSFSFLRRGRGFGDCVAHRKILRYQCHIELQPNFLPRRYCSQQEPLIRNIGPRPSRISCCLTLVSIYEVLLSDEIRCEVWRKGQNRNHIAGKMSISSRLIWVPS